MSVRVLWEGSFFAHHSLAVVNREIALALSGTPALRVAIRSGEDAEGFVWDPERIAVLRRLEAESESPADVCVRHQWPLDVEPPKSGKWVLMQPWEYGSIPRSWYEPMRFGADEVWVYSSHNKACYVEAGIPEQRVRVVPLGVQREMLGAPDPYSMQTRKRFKFLFVGGTIPRKGIDLLLEAYTRAFRREDDVCLVIKEFGAGSFYRGQTYGAMIRELQRDPRAPEIEYVTDDLAPEQLRDLYHACDCLVHPYRGEGFGLPIAEAMACGLPVIVPDQGGASDFCTPETAILVSSRREWVPAHMARSMDPVGRAWWQEVSLPELRARMRAAYEEPADLAGVALRGREMVRSRFTWERAAESAAGALTTLAGGAPLALHADADAQYAMRVREGVACWERRSLQTALRHFGQARVHRDTPDVLFNIASVLLVNGDTATAAQILGDLAERLRAAGDEADRALLADVEAALASYRPSGGEPAPRQRPATIRWNAPIFNASGYANESRAFLEGFMEDPDWRVALTPHDDVRDRGVMSGALFGALRDGARVSAADAVVDFQHGPASAFVAPAARISVCRTMFESDRIPDGWAEACNRFTEVWVPSRFNRDTFARAGVVPEKIRVVPGAIDASAYSPAHAGRGVRGGRGFQFLSVFDFTPRKGWDLLLRAYFEEFGADEDVSLVVKVVNFFREGRPEDRVRDFVKRHGFRNTPHLVLIDRECSEVEMREMYAGADAFVLASRGEGWGRPYMEAMAFAKPTIGTRWSANLEFMDDRNSFLVEIDGLEPCERTWSTMPLYQGHLWATPSLASLRTQMRRVFEDRQEAERRGQAARADIESKYDVPVVARQFRAELERVLQS